LFVVFLTNGWRPETSDYVYFSHFKEDLTPLHVFFAVLVVQDFTYVLNLSPASPRAESFPQYNHITKSLFIASFQPSIHKLRVSGYLSYG